VSTPQPRTSNRAHVMPRGKVLGGTSSLNGMVYLRGSRLDYDGWAAAGCSGWSWADVEPAFAALEEWLQPAVQEPHNPITEAMHEAAIEAGYRNNPSFDTGSLDGVGWNKSAIVDGERRNAHRAFVAPIRDRSNLHVLTGTRVIGVNLDGARATGVTVVAENGQVDVLEADEVVLCAGAFDSPRLLMRSGIGPASHLERVDIDPIVDLPVGENLIDHLLIGIVYSSKQPISEVNAFATEGGVFARSSPDAPDCDIEISFAKEPHFAPPADDGIPRYTIIPGITRPRSRGAVRLGGNGVDDELLIDPNYFDDPYDMAAMIQAIRLSREIGAQAALDDWNAGEFFPGPDVESDEAIAEYVANVVSTWFHPVGTCRMGVGNDAVVDPELRVRGVDGLRVADASIMPDIVSVNTNAAATMIGWKAADFIL
jgi:choline dehydrogenase